VDEFLRIVEKLERQEAEEQHGAEGRPVTRLAPTQLDVITATTAEEREFNELRRELPLATTVREASEVLFRHLRRIIPAANVTLYVPASDSGELTVVACSGVGCSAIEDLHVAIGDRISGWALAHKQAVLNSNATLELGPVAKTFAVPLRYALAVPILNGPHLALGVLSCYATEPFEGDHQRILESAATLFAGALAGSAGRVAQGGQTARGEDRRVH
jgi:hypothetical protein